MALLTGNVRWLANDLSFYQRGYERQSSYQSTGIPKEELDRATREMISYFNSGGDFSSIQVRVGGRTFPLFNERDVVHLRDVRDLIQLTYRIQEVSLAYIVLFSAAPWCFGATGGPSWPGWPGPGCWEASSPPLFFW